MDPQADWIIRAAQVDPSNYYGVTVANGVIGLVSAPEPLKIKDVVMAGVYDRYGRGNVSNFLRNFSLLNMTLSIDGRTIGTGSITGFAQELNMRDALFKGSFDYADKASVEYSYYSLRHLPYTVFMDVTIQAHRDIAFTCASVMEAPDELRDVENHFHAIDTPERALSLLTSSAKSPTGKLRLCASETFLFPEQHGEEPRVSHEARDTNSQRMKFTKRLKAGESYRLSMVASAITSAQHDDPLNEAERLTIYASLQGRDRLLAAHRSAWEEIWSSDIVLTGDPESQRDIRSMLYHLYSFCAEGAALSPSPMGLSGLGYNGHVFWDAELWMFPAILIMRPPMARSMIEYRFQRLEAAKRNALSRGYKGAMYPWESADTGAEETPVWALSGALEHHITACVGIAAWTYYCVTQDITWLRERGWPILSATADFWASRVERSGPGHYDIKNVMGADEWAVGVDNDAFTNAAARANLRYAAQVAILLNMQPNPDWTHVADNIPILKFPDGVTKEHATYHGEPIKQADVNLLAYPLREVTDADEARADLDYYSNKVPDEGTPAMTKAVFATLCARLGDAEAAYTWFKKSYRPNLNPPFRVIAETKGGTNPYFATGAGGVLQSVLMGFGGLEITPTGIEPRSQHLPATWQSLNILRGSP